MPKDQKKFRCLYRRCPPLPIPNREVKPARADGTAVKCGRVGRCPILKKPLWKHKGFLVLCWSGSPHKSGSPEDNFTTLQLFNSLHRSHRRERLCTGGNSLI